MDSRTAAHVLSQIAAHLELNGENTFKCRAYAGAAKGLLALGADDLKPLYENGDLAGVRGIGPATLAVLRDLVETGESRYLEQLRATTPEGLLEMLRVPGMTPARIHLVYETLGIETVEALEAAAKDGRLAALPKWGPKTAAKILHGIATMREHAKLRLYRHAVAEAQQLLEAVRGHPDVAHAEIAGDIRRRREVAGDVEIVAACRRDPVAVAQSFARLPGIAHVAGGGATVAIQFVDGAHLTLHCVPAHRFAAALWMATGTPAHVDAVRERLAARGVVLDDARLADEAALYRLAGLDEIAPELREDLGEIDAAERHALPALITLADIRGVLHCHSYYSDGKASILDMAKAAQARGWSYLGITDHSQAAFYAGGLSPDDVRRQHAEIDEVNAMLPGFRVLKGIEADILADGQLDYDDALLDRFEFVVGSVHSRFAMDVATMTARVLRALDDPRLTILAHPTGRLLLSRAAYAIDLDSVLAKAREVHAAVELNADPHRLDLDWRHLRTAKSLGVTIEIGPDAHSTLGLDYMEIGIGIARKGWLEPSDVLNTRSAEDVLAFARARRASH